MGSLVFLTKASVSLTILGMSFNIPAPAPLQTTFFTGQPKFISMRSGCEASTISTERNIASKLEPKI